MDHVECTFCSGDAIGLDEDGDPTCGAACCTPMVFVLPDVVEVSGEDDEDSAE